MDFQIGDQVVHRSYGPGEVILKEEKILSGFKSLYYVVKIGDLTLWVPVGEAGTTSLRFLTPAAKFEKLYAILRSPGEPLAGDRMERRTQLIERMKDGRLETICRVIRDLWFFKHTQKMNDFDSAILNRLQKFFLSEWTHSMPISLPQATERLRLFLDESLSRSE